ncbi:MAG: filamentous hemagglutinin N-terminal domain-containing protein, partial [Chlorobium sp.]|nr:filamentous hemagglutinin N-terminal domain-containing protein [Chlorobium sp.]
MNKIFNVIWSKTKEQWIVVSERVKTNGGVPKSPLRSLAVLAAMLLAGEPAFALDPGALPAGGQITAGSATIAVSGARMTVNQASQQMIANWNSFNIGSSAAVQFNQPNTASSALNRITDQNPTQIMGSLSANGKVFLVNPSGVIFGKTARVDVGGITASTLDMLDSDFLAGKNSFKNSGNAGSVINQGVLNAMPGGVVALIGPKVSNEGTITAQAGSVALAAGNQVSIDFAGDGLICLTVDQAAVDALAENKGLIKADGGLVMMTARAADALMQQVLSNSGVIEANTLVEKNGRIILDGGEGGVTQSTGTIMAKGENPGEKGGSVVMTGEKVGLFDSAVVDVSGEAGGGTVNIGGGFQGKDVSIHNATATYVAPSAKIHADATTSGDGGKIVVWADGVTRFMGSLSAKGGELGGNGGFAEVSGKGQLDFQGSVDLTALGGKAGTLLLDPYDVTISTGTDLNIPSPFAATGDSSVLNVTTLQNALGAGNVQVTTGASGIQSGDITIANSVGWFSDYSLTLTAQNNITINTGVNISAVGDGGITLTATAGSIANAGKVRTYGAGALTAHAAGAISGAGSYNVVGTSSFISDSGSITLSAATNKFTGAVSLDSGDTGIISLTNSQNTSLGAISAGTGGVTVASTGNITGSSSFASGGAVSLSTASGSAGNINLGGTFAASGSVSLSADSVGGISIADINGTATFALVSAGGAITLGNTDTGVLTFDSTGDGNTNVITGNAAAGGQASGIITVKGTSIVLNDPIRTKGGNVNFIATNGAFTANPASSPTVTNVGGKITTTAGDDTGTASGSVTVTATSDILLQDIVTTGASNTLGVGSNAAAVTVTSSGGNINIGAVTTSGGDALAGTTTNRNGGNAGSIILGATSGTIINLNGDLKAIGGARDGTGTQGLGGYIDVKTPVVLTANRLVTSGDTSGDIEFESTINSDTTSRSLTVTAGTGWVT